MHTHPWEFGWDALVAIGTLGLAGVTARLAATTRRLASATSDDVKAQWRPALIPGTRGREGTPLAATPLRYDPTNARLFVSVRNGGRGPALFVRALLDPEQTSPDLWNLGAVAPGDEVQLTFSGVNSFDAAKQVLLDYRDLGGRQYASALVLDKVTANGQDTFRYYDVRLFTGTTVTPHGDALPQPGLQELPDEQ